MPVPGFNWRWMREPKSPRIERVFRHTRRVGGRLESCQAATVHLKFCDGEKTGAPAFFSILSVYDDTMNIRTDGFFKILMIFMEWLARISL